MACGTTSTVPPVSQAPQISQTEKSKAKEWKKLQVSSGPRLNSFPEASIKASTLALLTMTPLGRPVEPEV